MATAGRKHWAQLANRHTSAWKEATHQAQSASASACPGTSNAIGVRPQRSWEERREKKEHTKGKNFLLLLQLTPLNFIPPSGSPVSKNNLDKGKNCRGRKPQKSCSWKIQKRQQGNLKKKKRHILSGKEQWHLLAWRHIVRDVGRLLDLASMGSRVLGAGVSSCFSRVARGHRELFSLYQESWSWPVLVIPALTSCSSAGFCLGNHTFHISCIRRCLMFSLKTEVTLMWKTSLMTESAASICTQRIQFFPHQSNLLKNWL